MKFKIGDVCNAQIVRSPTGDKHDLTTTFICVWAYARHHSEVI